MFLSMKLLLLKNLRLLVVLGCITYAAGMGAANNDELIRLEAEMLNYIDMNDKESFTRVAEELKAASKEEGNDRMFYRAWGNQGFFESTHQNYEAANEIARQIMEDARNNGSLYGEYEALHTRAMTLLQQHNYAAADTAFHEAVSFHKRHFPKESNAEDLRELMKIAYHRGDMEMAKKYGKQILAEPNLTPHHKGRTLYRLCVIAFEEENVEEFNKVYDEMKELHRTKGIKEINLYTEVNYHIINGNYKQALLLVDRLTPDSCAGRKAVIYHCLGDNEKAYEYMVQYLHLSDSLERESHAKEVGSLYLRMNNDRLRLERELLSHQNSQLRYRYYFAVVILLVLVLLFIIYQRHKIIKLLRQDNSLLEFEKDGAERSLENLNLLSFYESKTSLPLTTTVKVNQLCDRLATLTQKYCQSGVITVFQTDLSDTYEIKTNFKALEKLLTLLLNDSARFTRNGMIKLICTESGGFVSFSITDTGLAIGEKAKRQFSGLFDEEDNNERNVGMNFNVCQSISRLLHGRIWHDMRYTKGTRFFFVIPQEPQQQTQTTNNMIAYG